MTRSRSPSASRSRSKSAVSRSNSRSRSKSPPRHSRSKSRSRSNSRPAQRGRRRSSRRSESRSRSHSRKKSVSPMSSRKRHVGNREDPPSSKCLGIFGLSLHTTEREIRDLFGRYGRVQSCQIVSDHSTGRSRGFGFVTMEKYEDAEDAKESLGNEEVDGRRIRVDYSITRRPHSPTPGLYMGRDSQRSRPQSSSRRGKSRSRSRSRSPSRDRNRGRDRY